ncbi:hypothetical protein XENORESO_019004 [Xenotaenia resolanae]|uniref:Uncharacterized protein n=1 Tax=Xenotaenia resolanae TaxID=208358 RepID=A0ABV0X9L4_9TELE
MQTLLSILNIFQHFPFLKSQLRLHPKMPTDYIVSNFKSSACLPAPHNHHLPLTVASWWDAEKPSLIGCAFEHLLSLAAVRACLEWKFTKQTQNHCNNAKRYDTQTSHDPTLRGFWSYPLAPHDYSW